MYDPRFELFDRLNSLPPDYPVYIPLRPLTEEETFEQFNQQQDRVQCVSKQFDIASWVAINQIIPLPIENWLGTDEWQQKYGLSEDIKRAISKEVEEIARARNNARLEAERKFEMEKMQATSKLQFPRDPGSTTAHLFR